MNATPDVGAVTWCNGMSGCVGPVTVTNSLVGSHTGDDAGDGGPYHLTNGNYVVLYPYWDNGSTLDAGAARWCSGAGGCTGPITPANALVGSTTNENVGMPGFTRLANGAYVLSHNGIIWCSGTSGCIGPAVSANKLASGGQVYPLSNGNFVVSNTGWTNGSATGAGAVTWCSGTSGCAGTVTAENSLVGSATGDDVGDEVIAFPNGSYTVYSKSWDNGAVADAGAVTWCNGTGICAGLVSETNSLVGSQAYDFVGSDGITPLSIGTYVVVSSLWDNGSLADSGAITWSGEAGGVTVGQDLRSEQCPG